MAASRKNRSFSRKLHLSLESLEARQMMTVNPALAGAALPTTGGVLAPIAAVPVLNSLPGAAKSIFLDFDGDFQSTWTRTDSNQTYRNVSVGASNLTAEQMRKVWETVAEDYAPFNVNVTTVQPASFADGTALRVVIAGDTSAQLVVGNKTVTVSGNRFITDDNGATLTDTSGYSAIGSFTNSQPNVVYVFAKYESTWGTTSPEGHARTLTQLVANTASHEAGHAFGLVHNAGLDSSGNASDYSVGGVVTTPIMGDNTAADRTLWSVYTAGGGTVDSIAKLTSVLGARFDDHASGSWFAEPLSFSGTGNWFTTRATVSGIVGTSSDQDWFKFTTGGAGVTFDLKTVEFANLDAKLDVYKMTDTWFGKSATLIASIDGPTLYGAPFTGLGASYAANLAAGEYAVAVRSHGGYADLGNYTLTVTQNTLLVVNGGTMGYAMLAAPESSTTPTKGSLEGAPLAKSAGGMGQGAGGMGSIAAASSSRAALFDAAWNHGGETTTGASLVAKPAVKLLVANGDGAAMGLDRSPIGLRARTVAEALFG